jgi:hypothetical protein
MILEHIAVFVLFSGPLFWVGLWMSIDPAPFAWVPELAVRVRRDLERNFAGPASEPTFKVEHTAASRRLRRAVRIAGVALVVFAVAV